MFGLPKEVRKVWVSVIAACIVGVLAFSIAVRHDAHGGVPSNNWCVPGRFTTLFEGHWRGLVSARSCLPLLGLSDAKDTTKSYTGVILQKTFWGQLPTDSFVRGRASVIQNDTHHLLYFRYSVGDNVMQEQWAVWEKGKEHISIGRNITFQYVDNQTLAVSACMLLEREPATIDNSPAFCGKTEEVEMQFDRFVRVGDIEMQEWVIPTVDRMKNASLKLVMQPPTSHLFSPTPGHPMLLPVWHNYGDGKGYHVNHIMYDTSPDVDESVFHSMPDPTTCRAANNGLEMDPALSDEMDVAVRAICGKDYAEGRSCKGIRRHIARMRDNNDSRCPFAKMLSKTDTWNNSTVQPADPQMLHDHRLFRARRPLTGLPL